MVYSLLSYIPFWPTFGMDYQAQTWIENEKSLKKKLHIFNMSIDKFFFIQQVLLDKQKNTMSWLI